MTHPLPCQLLSGSVQPCPAHEHCNTLTTLWLDIPLFPNCGSDGCCLAIEYALGMCSVGVVRIISELVKILIILRSSIGNFPEGYRSAASPARTDQVFLPCCAASGWPCELSVRPGPIIYSYHLVGPLLLFCVELRLCVAQADRIFDSIHQICAGLHMA